MRVLPIAVLLALLFPARAFAEGTPLPPDASPRAAQVVSAGLGDPCCPSCPRWTVTPGLWVFGIDGQVGAGGRVVDVNSNWTDSLDLIDKIEFALNMRARVEWRHWTATIQVDGMTLEDSVTFREGALGLAGKVGLWFLQADVGSTFLSGRLGCGPCSPVLCMEGYAGIRAAFVSLELASTGLGAPNAVDKDMSWVDPLVGVRAHLDLNRRLSLALEGDIGGFGVGSDFSWNLLVGARWNMSRTFGLVAGWRILDIDYSSGSDLFDAQLSGPFLGLSITF